MRVSLVGLTEGEVSFAPHDHSPWLRFRRSDNLLDAEVELGQVGDLEVDDSGWMFEADDDQHVALVALAERGGNGGGNAGQMMFALRSSGNVLDLAGHGIEARLKGKAQHLKFWRLVPRRPGEPFGHFDHPDLAKWAEKIDADKAAAEEERDQNRDKSESDRQRSDLANHFVNPYTFVPFPAESPQRCAPAGHHRLEDGRFSGRITARLIARSPLLVRNVGTEAPKDGMSTGRRVRTGCCSCRVRRCMVRSGRCTRR